MRPKKDPGIRREAFITAAKQLFKEHGYEGVSVRSVLDAVGDKSTSVGLFYYYFKSKDDLYRECIRSVSEDYVSGFRTDFEKNSVEDWIREMLANIRKALSQNNRFMAADSETDRLFILDMKEKITFLLAVRFSNVLEDVCPMSAEEAELRAYALCGGIGDIMFGYMSGEMKKNHTMDHLLSGIAQFTLDVLPLAEDRKKEIFKRVTEET